MKKSIVVCMVICLQYTVLTHSWEVHVVPVYKDKTTGSWSGLFGRDPGLNWSSFKQNCTDVAQASACAAQLLQKQTHDAFVIGQQQMEKLKSKVQLSKADALDIEHLVPMGTLYFVPVEYVSAPELQKKKEKALNPDITKDKFAWLPIDEVLARRTVIKLVRGSMLQYKFDSLFRNMLKECWSSKALPELNALSFHQIHHASKVANASKLKVSSTRSRIQRNEPKMVKMRPNSQQLSKAYEKSNRVMKISACRTSKEKRV